MPVGPLVAGRGELELRRNIGVATEADHAHRPGVGNIGQERTQGNDQAYSTLFGNVQAGGRIRLPAQIRLNAQTEDHVAFERRGVARKELVGRPTNLTVEPVSQAHLGPDLAEIIKFFRVDRGETLGLESFDEELRGMRRRTAGIVPAGEGDNQGQGRSVLEFVQ